jgi:hypothetical protein
MKRESLSEGRGQKLLGRKCGKHCKKPSSWRDLCPLPLMKSESLSEGRGQKLVGRKCGTHLEDRSAGEEIFDMLSYETRKLESRAGAKA